MDRLAKRGQESAESLRRAATEVAASSNWIAALVSEEGEHSPGDCDDGNCDSDFDGDGALASRVLQLHGTTDHAGSWWNSEYAATELVVNGDGVAIIGTCGTTSAVTEVGVVGAGSSGLQYGSLASLRISSSEPSVAHVFDGSAMSDCFEVEVPAEKRTVHVVPVQFSAPSDRGQFEDELIIK